MRKLLVPVIYLRDGKAVSGFGSETVISELPVEELAADFSDRGADELLVLDFSKSDAEHDQAISALIRICDRAEVPVIGGGNVRRMEDVKKILYAGCKKAVLNFSKESNCELLEEVSGKFGKEKSRFSCRTCRCSRDTGSGLRHLPAWFSAMNSSWKKSQESARFL